MRTAEEILAEDERVQRECDVCYNVVCRDKDGKYRWETPYFEHAAEAWMYANDGHNIWTKEDDQLQVIKKVKW